MPEKKSTDHDKTIHQLVEVVLRDILTSVLDEFETATGARIGRVQISDKHELTDERRIEVDIRKADSESLSALMRYQKLLCEHEPMKDTRLCKPEPEPSE